MEGRSGSESWSGSETAEEASEDGSGGDGDTVFQGQLSDADARVGGGGRRHQPRKTAFLPAPPVRGSGGGIMRRRATSSRELAAVAERYGIIVSIDNTSVPGMTRVTVRAADFTGILRTVTRVLTAEDLTVRWGTRLTVTKSCTLNSRPSTRNLQPSTLNPERYETLHPES